MKKQSVVLLGLVLTLMLGCGNAEKKAEVAQDEAAMKEAITITEVTPLVDVANSLDTFVGKEVLVEGKVDGRCMASGCWISLTADGVDKSLIVTTPDESYIFPEESMGQVVQVQGTLRIKNEEEIAAHEANSAGADHACPNPIYYLHVEAMKIKA